MFILYSRRRFKFIDFLSEDRSDDFVIHHLFDEYVYLIESILEILCVILEFQFPEQIVAVLSNATFNGENVGTLNV